MALELESERFPASGGAAADGVLNQLGRPNSDSLTLLIREAVQNSWDARDGNDVVRFQADFYELAAAAKSSIHRTVFNQMAPGLEIHEEFARPGGLQIMAISDFGTVGLGGNTRADLAVADGAPTHFVDLVRNLGRRTDRQFSGGTYGFGKAAAFWASRIKTVAIYSKFKVDGQVKSRFIVTALGQQFTSEGEEARKCTGRHWWGRVSGDPLIAEPVEGHEADDMAALFQKFELRTALETGTTLFIVAPNLSGLDPQPAMERVNAILRYYFWPKLVDGILGAATMRFAVRFEDVDLPTLSVEFDQELQIFSQAFRATQGADVAHARVRPRYAHRPERLLGQTSFVRELTRPFDGVSRTLEEDEDQLPLVVFQRPLRHIALMREPHFVVRYEVGQPTPLNLAEYAGVFLANSSLDSIFAKAEPPTHDDWVPDLLNDKLEKSSVTIARRRVRDALAEMVTPEETDSPPYVPGALAEFSRMLGGLIPSIEPPGRRNAKPPSSGGNGRGGLGDSGGRGGAGTQARAELTIVAQNLVLYAGQRALAIRFSLSASQTSICRVRAIPKVRLLDGMEGEPPAGALAPEAIAWTDLTGNLIAAEISQCDLRANSEFLVYVALPADTVVSVGLEVEEVMNENG